ncbi:MAG: DUF5103 domain-containing protein [Flavobacteriaceae bacterium]|nr:DUF5103 domain-containing protein [Flavobacteriaceae bacterium]
MKTLIIILLLSFNTLNFHHGLISSVLEFTPPFLKSIKLKNYNQKGTLPFIIGDEKIELSFDDLTANENDYYYKISYHNSDWSESNLFKNEYLNGLDNIRISNFKNSFNTLKRYTNYKLEIPNNLIQLKLSGNYMINVYNTDDELQFSRKFLYVKPKIDVDGNVYRTRDLNLFLTHHNIRFEIVQDKVGYIKNPNNNLKIVILQNDQWFNKISKLKPQYQENKILKFRYDIISSFESGNEFLFFDTKDLRINGLNTSFINLEEVYHVYLYTDIPRKYSPYSFYQDLNGEFEIRTVLGSQNPDIESDYSWVHFTLAASIELPETKIYVMGNFNNYEPDDQNLMIYNKSLEAYELKILLKQGYYNYKYVAKTKSNWDFNLISGNYYQTENSYKILVYYRPPGEIYDQLIGLKELNSRNIFN